MKQHIAPEQLQELTDEQKERLLQWWMPPGRGDSCAYFIKNGHGEYVVAGTIDNLMENIVTAMPLPLLSIGQMIELLEGKATYIDVSNMYARLDNKPPAWGVMKPDAFDIRADELADALFQAVKAVL